MQLEQGYFYHIYNQGNNKQEIFFSEENYLFFLKKIRKYILPYCDIIAYCLMPNHFHLMVRINRLSMPTTEDFNSNEELSDSLKLRSFNQSIGIMLRTYTRAVNKKNNRSDSLFRKETKAICLDRPSDVAPSFYNTNWGTVSYLELEAEQYTNVCFDYIHQNPVAAKLVESTVDWEYSSARDYAGLRNGTLPNKDIGQEFQKNFTY